MSGQRSAQLVVIGSGYMLGGAALYAGLPGEIPPVLTVPGRGDLWLGVPMVAFLLPTALAVTDALLRTLCHRHPVGGASTTDVLRSYDAIMLRFSIFLIAVHLTVLLALLGVFVGREWAGQIVPLMLGFTMISVGNLLPRTRPNLAIGIRTEHTLSSRSFWISVHRSAGYIVVAAGAVIVLSAIAVPAPVGPGMILLVGPAVLVGTWLFVRFSRRRARA
jgi:SdpI/YfhL protein family